MMQSYNRLDHERADRRCLIDRDRVMNADRKRVAAAMVRAFDALQSVPQEQRLMALAGAFLLLARATGFPAQDIFSAVTNLMYDPVHPSKMDHRFAAMLYHLEQDVVDMRRH